MGEKAQQPNPSSAAPNPVDSVSQAPNAGRMPPVTHLEHAHAAHHVHSHEAAGLIREISPGSSTPSTAAAAPDSAVPAAPGASGVLKLVNDLERGQGVMDKLIQLGLSGRMFNNNEMLALQAGVFKYAQEVELTAKVVDKGSEALKDTLKTQI